MVYSQNGGSSFSPSRYSLLLYLSGPKCTTVGAGTLKNQIKKKRRKNKNEKK
jgi:hypothetical protein